MPALADPKGPRHERSSVRLRDVGNTFTLSDRQIRGRGILLEINKFIINDYKYERNLKLDVYRFVNTQTVVVLLKNIAECITNYNVSYIKLVNEFGIIRVKSLEILQEELDKSQLVFSLELFLKGNESNNLKSAILVDFKEFENIKYYSAIKLYSDDKDWIIKTEEKINKYLEPFKTWKKIFRSTLFTGIITTLLATFFIAQIYGGLNVFLIAYKPNDFITFFGVAFFTIFMVYIFQMVFFPRFKLKDGNNFINKFKATIGRQKENIYISLFIAITFFILGLFIK